uniref:Uncharacterized protein n=1 Tax=Ficedula albicollis TaxID=59894 RepID=A0A803VGQ4_FICAL
MRAQHGSAPAHSARSPHFSRSVKAQGPPRRSQSQAKSSPSWKATKRSRAKAAKRAALSAGPGKHAVTESVWWGKTSEIIESSLWPM